MDYVVEEVCIRMRQLRRGSELGQQDRIPAVIKLVFDTLRDGRAESTCQSPSSSQTNNEIVAPLHLLRDLILDSMDHVDAVATISHGQLLTRVREASLLGNGRTNGAYLVAVVKLVHALAIW